MTRIPELGVTLSVSRLDTALKERKSSTKRGRHTSLQRKAERSPNTGGFQKTSANIGSGINGSGDGSVGYTELDSTSSNVLKSSLGQSEDCKKRSSKNNLDVTEGSEKFRISSTAAKLSPRLTHNKEKCHRQSVGKRDLGREPLRAELLPQQLRTDVDAVDDDDDDDEGDERDEVSDAKTIEKGEVKMKYGVTARPRSDSRLSQSRRERTKNTRASSGVGSCPSRETAPRPPNHQPVLPPSASKESGIPDDESEGPESKIRQIWRKELGLDDRPSRRLFVPKEYITGLAVGYPGQKAALSQRTVTTAVVPTAKLSVNEIQKRLKVLPPIDNKAKAKNSKDDVAEKPPAPNRVKDINALAADLCRGATLKIGNSEAEAVYRTYRAARKDAFYFDLHSNVGSARSKYHRPCNAPPNSDDDQGVQEVWNDSSYTRIVRIASPDTDGETVITHTVDASKVFDFGGRVIRKMQIDVFLPSDVQVDEIQSGNDDDGNDGGNEDRRRRGNKNDTRVVQQHIGSKEQGNKRTNGEKDQLIENIQNSAAYEEDDEEDSDDDCSDENSDSDDEDDDDDEDY